jgi:hypothetical protein
LEWVAPLASKRGRKTEIVFPLFLMRLADAVHKGGVQIIIPPNKIIFDNMPPFFSFIVEVVNLTIKKGHKAIEESKLNSDEKLEAARILSHYNKTPRAMVHYLREISRELQV